MRDNEDTIHYQLQLLQREIDDCRQTLLKPPSTLPLSEWVEENYYLSTQASSLPGKFRFNLTPFQREIFDTLNQPEIRKVVVVSSSQVVKTQAILCFIIWMIYNDPSPTLVVNYTNQDNMRFSKQRLDIALKDNGVDKLRQMTRGRQNVTMKQFPGGFVSCVSAGSVGALAALPIKNLICDEVDRYDVTKEGSAVDIAFKRTTTYFNSKTILTSSPGDESISRIWVEYQNSDRREYYVPCHSCGFEQTLVWEQVTWTETGNPNDAKYRCIKCQSEWNDIERRDSIQKGRWIASKPNRSTVGFHINTLYSPFKTLGELAVEFTDASIDIERLRTFYNTRLGLPWKDESEGVTDIRFINRVEKYNENTINNNILLITIGVDVQGDRVELEVVGWGVGDESWSLEYQVLKGDPTTTYPWEQLQDYVQKSYTRDDGVKLYVHAMAVDCNYLTQDVLIFTNKFKSKGVIAVRGQSGFSLPIFTAKARRSKYNGYKYYNIGVDVAKQRLYRQLMIKEPGPGYCHFPDTRDDEYFKQLTSEVLVTRHKRGRQTKNWEKREANIRGEALDTRVYAMAARFTFTVDMNRRVDILKQKVKVEEKKPEQNKQLNTSKPINKRNITPFRKSNLIKGLGF